MITQNTVEEKLMDAISVKFIPSEDYSINPPVIAFVFSDLIKAVNAYAALAALFDMDRELTFSFKGSISNTMDVSIIQKDTADAVNRKGIFFSKYNLHNFLLTHHKDINYTIIFGFNEHQQDTIPIIGMPFNPPKFFKLAKLFIDE